MKNTITVNWHLTQACNYQCYYCFAHYQRAPLPIIHKNTELIKALLSKLHSSLSAIYKTDNLRLNLAGGEPFLVKNLGLIIQIAHQIGFKVSIITNASLLDKDFIVRYVPYLSVLGMSIDSALNHTNKLIGRCDSHQRLINTDSLKSLVSLIREHQRDLDIKINTVVNAYNYQEDLSELIEYIAPSKWKIFQALSINTQQNFCTDEQFQHFLDIHRNVKAYVCPENKDLMTNSYIMVDPYGRFFQNAQGTYHDYSPALLTLNEEQIACYLQVDLAKYALRYQSTLTVSSAA